jgi:hypothetical protein
LGNFSLKRYEKSPITSVSILISSNFNKQLELFRKHHRRPNGQNEFLPTIFRRFRRHSPSKSSPNAAKPGLSAPPHSPPTMCFGLSYSVEKRLWEKVF